MPHPSDVFKKLHEFQDLTQKAYSSYKHGELDEMYEAVSTLREKLEGFEEWMKEKGGRAHKERDIQERTER